MMIAVVVRSAVEPSTNLLVKVRMGRWQDKRTSSDD